MLTATNINDPKFQEILEKTIKLFYEFAADAADSDGPPGPSPRDDQHTVTTSPSSRPRPR
jgi:hypothetical protein